MELDPTTVELPTIFEASTCVRKGLCPVSKLRGQEDNALESHSLYYELHGKGSKFKYIFIMGLNSSSFAWSAQVAHFAKQKDSTVLVFDNRGVGNSGYPKGPYTTSGMAEDVICLLNFIGWKEKRDLNIIGISLGGMIAQELSYRIPERIASLTLAVTTPGGLPWNNLPPWSGVKSLARLMVTLDVEKKVPIVMPMLFPLQWLSEKAADDSKGRTNYDVQTENFLRRVTITKPQQFLGHISQMCAGLTHYVSPERLRKISASIPKVTIVTGDVDNLVRPSGSFRLKEAMPEAELQQWENTGHGIHAQCVEVFNTLIERTAQEGKARVDAGWEPAPV